MAFHVITTLNAVLCQNVELPPHGLREVSEHGKSPRPETELMAVYGSTFSVVQALLDMPRERLKLYKAPSALIELIVGMERALSYSNESDPTRIPNAERVLITGFDILASLASHSALLTHIFFRQA